MTLTEDIEYSIYRSISNIKITEKDLTNLDSYHLQNKEILNVVEKKLDRQKLKQAFEYAVFREANECLYQVMENEVPIVEIRSPTFFAYIMKNTLDQSKANRFPLVELRKMVFDEGQNAESFIKQYYNKDMLDGLVNRLFGANSSENSSSKKLNQFWMEFSEYHC